MGIENRIIIILYVEIYLAIRIKIETHIIQN